MRVLTLLALGVVGALAQNDSNATSAAADEVTSTVAADGNATSAAPAQPAGNATSAPPAPAGNSTVATTAGSSTSNSTSTSTTTTTTSTGSSDVTATAGETDSTSSTPTSTEGTTSSTPTQSTEETSGAPSESTTGGNSTVTTEPEEKTEVAITQVIELALPAGVREDQTQMTAVFSGVKTGVATGICAALVEGTAYATADSCMPTALVGTAGLNENTYENGDKSHTMTVTASDAGRRSRRRLNSAVSFSSVSKAEVPAAAATTAKTTWDTKVGDSTSKTALVDQMKKATEQALTTDPALSSVNITVDVKEPAPAVNTPVDPPSGATTSGAFMVATAGASMLVAALLL